MTGEVLMYTVPATNVGFVAKPSIQDRGRPELQVETFSSGNPEAGVDLCELKVVIYGNHPVTGAQVKASITIGIQ